MRVLTIAGNTFKQAMHLPVLYVVVIGSVVLLAIVGQLPRFTLVIHDDIKMLKDLAITTATLCGILVAIFTAVNTITGEIENWTVVTVLSKPVTRGQFVLGKFIGLAVFLATVFCVLTVVYTLLVWWGMWTSVVDYQNIYPELKAGYWKIAWETADELWRGMALCLLQVLVLAGVAVACCVRAPMIISVLVFFGTFVLGHMLHGLSKIVDATGSVVGGGGGALGLSMVPHPWGVSLPAGAGPMGHGIGVIAGRGTGLLRSVGVFVGHIIPDLEALNFAQEVGVGRLIRPAVIGWGALYAAIYCTAAVLIAMMLFRRREVI